jgi:hypothetical protein
MLDAQHGKLRRLPSEFSISCLPLSLDLVVGRGQDHTNEKCEHQTFAIRDPIVTTDARSPGSQQGARPKVRYPATHALNTPEVSTRAAPI